MGLSKCLQLRAVGKAIHEPLGRIREVFALGFEILEPECTFVSIVAEDLAEKGEWNGLHRRIDDETPLDELNGNLLVGGIQIAADKADHSVLDIYASINDQRSVDETLGEISVETACHHRR